MSDYRWSSADQRVVVGPGGVSISADPDNTDYAALVASGVEIAEYVAPAPTADDVRAEASRRMQALVGARGAAHLEIVIANGSREAIRLLRIGAGAWTPEQAARAAALEAVDAAIEAIRAASNSMETSPPADYTDDARWPL